jgi:hypothetical protein
MKLPSSWERHIPIYVFQHRPKPMFLQVLNHYPISLAPFPPIKLLREWYSPTTLLQKISLKILPPSVSHPQPAFAMSSKLIGSQSLAITFSPLRFHDLMFFLYIPVYCLYAIQPCRHYGYYILFQSKLYVFFLSSLRRLLLYVWLRLSIYELEAPDACNILDRILYHCVISQ